MVDRSPTTTPIESSGAPNRGHTTFWSAGHRNESNYAANLFSQTPQRRASTSPSLFDDSQAHAAPTGDGSVQMIGATIEPMEIRSSRTGHSISASCRVISPCPSRFAAVEFASQSLNPKEAV
jgi:hypothetical protein